jgi:hypothetical protein
VALRLCHEFKLSLDWIYRGIPDALPHGLVQKLAATRLADTGPRPKKARRKNGKAASNGPHLEPAKAIEPNHPAAEAPLPEAPSLDAMLEKVPQESREMILDIVKRLLRS